MAHKNASLSFTQICRKTLRNTNTRAQALKCLTHKLDARLETLPFGHYHQQLFIIIPIIIIVSVIISIIVVIIMIILIIPTKFDKHLLPEDQICSSREDEVEEQILPEKKLYLVFCI